jgi:hypothetical protein
MVADAKPGDKFWIVAAWMVAPYTVKAKHVCVGGIYPVLFDGVAHLGDGIHRPWYASPEELLTEDEALAAAFRLYTRG